ncbi:hypothetical protein [Sinorhizobium sp. BG8]|nr:hypothetical protein [Sinorhizobium sp. BG8]
MQYPFVIRIPQAMSVSTHDWMGNQMPRVVSEATSHAAGTNVNTYGC